MKKVTPRPLAKDKAGRKLNTASKRGSSGSKKKSIAATAKPTANATKNIVISSENDIRTGVKSLRRKCAYMRKAHELAGHPPLRRNEAGFVGLARIIVAQQVSVSAARAIWARVEAGVTPMTAKHLARTTDDDLRACGLSRPKIRTLRAIADAVNGGLDLDALVDTDEEDARAQLTEISGVGPWTADIYLMFCLGRADIFAPGDLALQIATQMLMQLDERPTKDEMAQIASRWSPWRGVAARLLWHYYAAEKSLKTATPT